MTHRVVGDGVGRKRIGEQVGHHSLGLSRADALSEYADEGIVGDDVRAAALERRGVDDLESGLGAKALAGELGKEGVGMR